MDHRSLPMYQHPRMAIIGQQHSNSVPGSIPINDLMVIPAQEVLGIQGAPMLDDHADLNDRMHLEKMPVEHHYNQLPLRKEVDDDGRIMGVLIPETSPIHIHKEEHDIEIPDISQQKIKTEEEMEEEDISNFQEEAYDTFLKVSSKELTIKGAADQLGRPYSYVYSRYQEFCDHVTGKVTPEKKKKKSTKKGKKKKRGKKKMTHNKSNSRTGNPYQCEECPAFFYTEYLIKAHSKAHDEKHESHKCTVCGWVFSKLLKLMQHRIEVHEDALQCPHCDTQFTVIADYRTHVRNHTGMKPFQCTECDKGFNSRYNLECHQRKHTGERPYMCGLCEKTFTTLGNLKLHRYVHTGGREKNIECEQCGKKFQFNSALMEHMNVHTQTKPYSCNYCDMRFNFKQACLRHEMTHTGDQPHKCNLCPAAFNVSTQLKNHMTAHTGQKPFKCDQCDYSCTRKHNLDFHKNTHTGETPFKCDFYGCTAEYSRPNSLKKHKLQHGPPPPQTCKVCHDKFPNLVALKGHMMIHTGERPHICEQCSKTFIDKASLKRHMYTHMYKPPGSKTKQVRQARKNPVVKKVLPLEQPVNSVIQKYQYQVPVSAIENGHNPINHSIGHTWTINAEDTNSSQPPFYSIPTTQYTGLVNNPWPSTMDPDELRRRLLNSFK